MSTTAIFITGFIIFFSYMFFLMKMIWKQHKIEEAKHDSAFEVQRSLEIRREARQAS